MFEPKTGNMRGMGLEISQPGDSDNTSGMFELHNDGVIIGRFRVYGGAERYASELVEEMFSDMESAFGKVER